ncbi:MAG: isochorismatase family protein [Peptoniphilus sp.]|nr:isochorismatase family protein [Peptoniphilus sp.]
MMKTLVVVDAQNDFIDGSLACENSENAIANIVKKINAGDFDKVVYSMDAHSPTNKSFKVNGGIWPVHCVEGEKGAELSSKFDAIENPEFKTTELTVYKKGKDDEVEEYSAYYAKNEAGESISDLKSDEFIVCGLASEYCVRETILEFKNKGKNVKMFLDGVGYVDREDHLKNIEELKNMGIEMI